MPIFEALGLNFFYLDSRDFNEKKKRIILSKLYFSASFESFVLLDVYKIFL
jgi:hypothetical protein